MTALSSHDFDIHVRILEKALASLVNEPGGLPRLLAFFSQDYPETTALTLPALIYRACSSDPNDQIKLLFHRALIRWDFLREGPWTKDTAPNTQERRNRTYQLLEVSSDTKDA